MSQVPKKQHLFWIRWIEKKKKSLYEAVTFKAKLIKIENQAKKKIECF